MRTVVLGLAVLAVGARAVLVGHVAWAGYGPQERPASVRTCLAPCVTAGQTPLTIHSRPPDAVARRGRGCHRGCHDAGPSGARPVAGAGPPGTLPTARLAAESGRPPLPLTAKPDEDVYHSEQWKRLSVRKSRARGEPLIGWEPQDKGIEKIILAVGALWGLVGNQAGSNKGYVFLYPR
jgi:hypothetical protein